MTNIALQPAWLGGDAVFEAREKLMIEVDDQNNNLRIAKNKNGLKANSLSIFPNPASEYLTIHSEIYLDGTLVITDAIGKTLLRKQLHNGFCIVNGLSNGFYFAQIFENNQVVENQKFYIVK